MPERLHSPAEALTHCDAQRARGRRVGLVPTMGALHEGHLSLVEAARQHGATHVVVSIFVNPLQFGEGEDFDRYPRTLDADIAKLREAGVDAVFAPSPRSMYPQGFQSHVAVEGVTQPLEGAHRPTHFQGVTTVVAKLFNAIGPCVATFGQKDYQQWRVLARMAQDLNMPVDVVGCPIVREEDGLALSSRNRYLSTAERTRATAIFRGLCAARDMYRAGQRDGEALTEAARAPVHAEFDSIDYVALADADDLSPLSGQVAQRCVLLVAAHLGTTRLIDNLVLSAPGTS